jgi:hypothetical protein
MNSARLPTNTNCTMAGTPATIPAATPPDPSKVANNRTAKSRNTCFEPFLLHRRWSNLARSTKVGTIGFLLNWR